MAKDVDQYCRNCSTCQQSKVSMPQRAALQNIPISQPWQMVAVDILQVPLSTNNNRYLLVLQDYFTKWAHSQPNCKPHHNSIDQFFSTYGPLHIIHSESQTKDEILKALFSCKWCMLLVFVSLIPPRAHLPLVLYVYQTSRHSSTGVSPYLLLFGKDPPNLHGLSQHAYDSLSHSATLQARLAELQDSVHANIVQAAANQNDQHTSLPSFKQGEPVWLSVPSWIPDGKGNGL